MNARQPNDKSDRKNVVRGGLWGGALVLAIAAIFATAGVRSGSPASEKSSTIRASQSLAADLAGPNIARAETDTLDLQLD